MHKARLLLQESTFAEQWKQHIIHSQAEKERVCETSKKSGLSYEKSLSKFALGQKAHFKNHFKDGCVGLALSTLKERLRTNVSHVVSECLAAYPQILTAKDVIQPLIEVAIRREPYVVEHRATTKHSRHGLWKEEKTTFFHATLSCKTWNFLFWGNHVLSCPKKIILQRNREEAHRTRIMFWTFVCFNDARVLKLHTFYKCLQHLPFHYGKGFTATQEATHTRTNNNSFWGGCNFSRNPNLNKPDVNYMFTRRQFAQSWHYEYRVPIDKTEHTCAVITNGLIRHVVDPLLSLWHVCPHWGLACVHDYSVSWAISRPLEIKLVVYTSAVWISNTSNVLN